MKTKILFKKYGLTLAGILVGAVGGLLYWKFVGCSSGTCPIASSPINSTLFGAVFGGFLFSSIGCSCHGNSCSINDTTDEERK